MNPCCPQILLQSLLSVSVDPLVFVAPVFVCGAYMRAMITCCTGLTGCLLKSCESQERSGPLFFCFFSVSLICSLCWFLFGGSFFLGCFFGFPSALLYPSGTKSQTDRVQVQERQYTRACIEAYRRQLIMGRHFCTRQAGLCQRCEN